MNDIVLILNLVLYMGLSSSSIGRTMVVADATIFCYYDTQQFRFVLYQIVRIIIPLERMVSMSSGSSIGRWISILYRYRLNYLGKRLESYNIGSGQHFFLKVLSKKDGINQEELSDFLKIDKATTAKAVKKLEEEGYVVRNVDVMDKRAYRVFLTNKALNVIPVIDEAVKDWEEFIAEGLSLHDMVLVEELLGKMAQNACRIKDKEGSKFETI